MSDVSESFERFAVTAQPRLRQALRAALGSEHGEEATAEALAYGFEHWGRIRTMTNPVGYLYVTGRNKIRRARRRGNVVLPAVPEARMPWVEPALPAALAALPERQRVSTMLVYGHDWSFTEVADLLGLAKSTVQVHAERGLAALRQHLGASE